MKKVSISSPTSSKTLAAGSASIAALLSASAANATIIYFNTPITSDNTTVGDVAWDIDGDGGVEAILINSGSIIGSFSKNLTALGGNFYVMSDSGSLLATNAAGQTIYDGKFTARITSLFLSGSLENTASISSGVSTYIGFKFEPSDDDAELYGWANVTLTNGNGFGTFVINEWAYDDSGSSIQAGQTSAVPEPATYALGLGALALGAAGLRRMRQRKRLAA